MPHEEIIGELIQTDDQAIEGWCYAPARPADRLDVDLWLDETLLASVTASADRPDLRDAGYGDGRHGFRLRIPVAVGATIHRATLIARECGTGHIFAELRLSEAGVTSDYDPARLNELLGKVEEAWERLNTPRQPAWPKPARDLARAFGLAGATLRSAARGRLVTGRAVAVLRDSLGAALAGTSLRRLAQPYRTLILRAGPDARETARAIAATAPWADALDAELLLLDAPNVVDAPNAIDAPDGAAPTDPRAALLPSLLPNLAYARSSSRTAAGQANDAALAARGGVLVFLRAAPTPAEDPAAVLLAMSRAELDALAGPAAAALIRGADSVMADAMHALPAIAPACLDLAITRDSFATLGGFDADMDDGAALAGADLLLRVVLLGARAGLAREPPAAGDTRPPHPTPQAPGALAATARFAARWS